MRLLIFNVGWYAYARFLFLLLNFSVLNFPIIHSYYFYNEMINHQMLFNALCFGSSVCDSVLLQELSALCSYKSYLHSLGQTAHKPPKRVFTVGLVWASSWMMSMGFIVEEPLLMCLNSHVSS